MKQLKYKNKSYFCIPIGLLVFFSLLFVIGCGSNLQENQESARPVIKQYQDEISVAMPINEDFFYQAVVSISSLIDTASDKTHYKIYALIPEDFRKEQIEKLRSLEKIRDNCRFEFINMNDEANNFLAKDFLGIDFYKLAVSTALLKSVKKCISLHPSTLVREDLSDKFHEVGLSDCYVAGVPGFCDFVENEEDYLQRLSIENFDYYINSGFLIWNLENCRKDKIADKFKSFLIDNKDSIEGNKFLDQDAINSVCSNKIFILPLAFNVFPNKKVNYNDTKFSARFSEEEWKSSNDSPKVINFSDDGGPWVNFNLKEAATWWNYARNTEFFNEFQDRYLFGVS
ncbi:MAG: hypothetical protein LBI55_03200 [Oscillospiraceae bacterium]|jgi:lipopolysaccharide biosynthesis glycosyltransferase|nr:hypothetical protein [Oscillospiraceae bacterium]